jgi:hypothetical protein
MKLHCRKDAGKKNFLFGRFVGMHMYQFLHEKSVAYRRYADIVSIMIVGMLSVEMRAEYNRN